jgi:hypothetical protein
MEIRGYLNIFFKKHVRYYRKINKNKKRGFKRIYGGLVSSVGEVASPWSVADDPMAVSASVGYAVAVNAIVCHWLWIAAFAGFLASDKAAHSISYRPT